MRVRLGGTRRTHTRPAPAFRLPAAYDVLDVPAAAGHRVLLQLERLGTPLGPVLAVRADGPGHEREPGGGRLRFFVEAGTTASFLADLKELGWDPADTDVRTIGVVLDSETPLPPAGSPRWVRPPEFERTQFERAQSEQAHVERAQLERAQWERTQADRPMVLPPARLLLGALAYACRRDEGRPGSARLKAARPPLWTS
ncbi:MAG: hypothetical protein HOV87_18135 [Catenulispora sp.]|nr:hypothetical protein [Catenulispora sp.]